MIFFNYGFLNPEWFFQLCMFCIFLFWINTVIHVLPEAPIWEITERANMKFDRKRQSKILPDFIIRNTKKNVQFYIETVLSLRNLVGCRKKNVGVQEETSLLEIVKLVNLAHSSFQTRVPIEGKMLSLNE